MIVVDADVLGRDRTGDETYVANLLQALAELRDDLRIAAITRDASLVPAGIEPLVLTAGSQELRMAWSVPRLLRRQAAPRAFPTRFRCAWRCPAVAHRAGPELRARPRADGAKDRAVFRGSCRARCVAPDACSRSPSGRSATSSSSTTSRRRRSSSRRSASTRRFAPAWKAAATTSSSSGRSRSARTRSRPWRPPRRTGSGSSSSAPRRTQAWRTSCASQAPTSGATCRRKNLPSSTAAPPRSCSRRATRASACPSSRRWRAARRSSPRPTRRSARSPGTRRSSRSRPSSAAASGGARRSRPARRRRARARARCSPGRRPRGARSTSTGRCSAVSVSAVVVSHGHADELERLVPVLAPQVDELVVVANMPGQRAAASPTGRACCEPRPLALRRERQPGHRGDERRARPRREPRRRA